MKVFIAGPPEAGEEAPPDKEKARKDDDVYRGSCRRPTDQLDYDEAEIYTWPAPDRD